MCKDQFNIKFTSVLIVSSEADPESFSNSKIIVNKRLFVFIPYRDEISSEGVTYFSSFTPSLSFWEEFDTVVPILQPAATASFYV